jgi:hypothetical protein
MKMLHEGQSIQSVVLTQKYGKDWQMTTEFGSLKVTGDLDRNDTSETMRANACWASLK